MVPPQPREPGAWRQGVLRLLREPFSRQAIRERRYAALSFLLAIPGFVFVVVALIVGLGLSLSFAGMLVGLPLLTVSLLGARRLGAVNRALAGRMLGQQVAPPPPPPRQQPGVVGWIRAGLTDRTGWRACAYLLLKLPVAVLSTVLASWILVYGIPYLTFPLWWEVLHQLGVVVTVPPWLAWWKTDPVTVAASVRTLAGAFALVPAGAVVLLVVPWMTRGVILWDQGLVAEFLGPPRSQRVRDLERTRAHAVDDAAARLRRIERDLHDGAQAQMVAVAMKLGLAREKLGGTVGKAAEADFERALELVDAAHASAKQAITELRDLARGIHPPVLDHGLGTALATLASGSGVPVELVVDLPERPSAAIETIAYFCAAELLGATSGGSAAGVGYLLKDRVADVGEFVEALSRVAAGGTALDPEVVTQLLGASRRADGLTTLTARERDVLVLAEGRSNAAIAGILVVTERAVEKHISNIFSKLGLAPSDADHRRVLAVLRYLEP